MITFKKSLLVCIVLCSLVNSGIAIANEEGLFLMESSKCSKCKCEKNISEFSSNKRLKRGIEYFCKDCRKQHMKKYHADKAKRKQQSSDYYLKNSDLVKSRAKVHRDRMKLECPAKWRSIKFFATSGRKKIANEVTVDYLENLFLTIKCCQCCGKDLNINYEKRKSNNIPSVDRVDNNKGYEIGNIGIICWHCNMRKTDLTLNDLKMFQTYINKYSNV